MGVVLTAFAGGAAAGLAPKGREQAGVRLVGGLMLLLALLSPLRGLGRGRISAEVFLPDRETVASTNLQTREDALALIIQEKTAAYISDKGAELGLHIQVQVDTELTAAGIPVPAWARICGAYDPRLSRFLEKEVGIPRDHQVWEEGVQHGG